MQLTNDLKILYETDDYQWLEETINLIKKRDFSALDLDNLIEELEDLGKEKRNALESYFVHLIEHLLLYHYWTDQREFNANNWKREIRNFRYELEKRLTNNLKNYVINNQDKIYFKAKKLAEDKSNLKLPSDCPYTFDQLLDTEWLPL
jgi:hypothetical protein